MSDSSGSTMKFKLISNSRPSISDAQQFLKEFVSKEIHERELSNECLSELSLARLAEIANICRDCTVKINWSSPNKAILAGQLAHITKCYDLIYKIVFAHMREKEADVTAKLASQVQYNKAHIQLKIPATWMRSSDALTFDLHANSAEYKQTAKFFEKRGMSGFVKQIVSIKRIQNKTLFVQYSAFKEDFATRFPGKDVERTLFHGTNAETVDKICSTGFNRSYSGKNATAYGQGAYFAMESKYSNHFTDIKQGKAQGCMFVCKVLVGNFALGSYYFFVVSKLFGLPKIEIKLSQFFVARQFDHEGATG